MKIKLKKGIDNLLFGDSEKLVSQKIGKSDKTFIDDEGNLNCIYNKFKLRLTFYIEPTEKLAYIECSHPKISLKGKKLIGKKIETVLDYLKTKGLDDFELEDNDSFESYFSNKYQLSLNVEFGKLTEINFGVNISVDDEYEWKS